MKRIDYDNKVLIRVTMVILIVFVVILTLPYFLTREYGWIDFTETGQIGDTIGGITAPFIAVCSAYITFLAFWVQYTYNKRQKTDLFQERFENNLFSYFPKGGTCDGDRLAPGDDANFRCSGGNGRGQ